MIQVINLINNFLVVEIFRLNFNTLLLTLVEINPIKLYLFFDIIKSILNKLILINKN